MRQRVDIRSESGGEGGGEIYGELILVNAIVFTGSKGGNRPGTR